jgi:predicted dehydrogenase
MGIMHAANLSTIPDARIVGLVDQQPQLAHHVNSLGLDAPFCPSVEQMLDRTEVDAVFVCTPASAHLPTAQACVRKGIHVFVEKPLADTLENARKMYDLVKGTTLVHAVGYMKGHYPLYQHMRALVQRGTLGRIYQCHCTVYLSQVFRPPTGWVFSKESSGGGIIINSTCHLLFLLQWFFGNVRGVFARARSIHSTVEDVATVVLEFEDGVVASVGTSWAVPGYSVEHTQMLIIGERGTLHLTDDRARLFLNRADAAFPQGWTAFHRSEFDKAPVDLSSEYGGEGYYNEDADFITCCANGSRPLVSWQEGLRVQEVIDAIYRSVDSGYVAL